MSFNKQLCLIILVAALVWAQVLEAAGENTQPEAIPQAAKPLDGTAWDIQVSLITEATEHVPPKLKLATPTRVTAKDSPNDAGNSITITWEYHPAEGEIFVPERFEILRSKSIDGPFETVITASGGARSAVDSNVENHEKYYYKIKALFNDQESLSQDFSGAISKGQWFHKGRIALFITAILFSFFILYNISQAKKGKELYIRPIAGLQAVDEAIGRATEMGKSVLYVPGIMDLDDVQTIASITILSHVARKAAEYETNIMVPCARSVVMTAAQEVVKEAYLDVGRPDAYDENQVRYLTDDQFGYAAGVDGIMVRDKPAANFFLGRFYAESLILAETGNSVGAIQIAGTAEASQLPFFVAACDYTLIGEELFAASAYLSKEPRLLGSLKGQDWAKFLIMAAIIIGSIPGLFHEFLSMQSVSGFFQSHLSLEGFSAYQGFIDSLKSIVDLYVSLFQGN